MEASQILAAFEKQLLTFGDKLVEFLPKLGSALVVFLVGLIFAYIVRFLMGRVLSSLEKTLRDKSLLRGLSFSGLVRASSWVSILAFWVIVIFALTISTEILGWNIVATWLTSVGAYLPKVAAALAISLLGLLASRLLREIVSNSATTAGLSYVDSLAKLTQAVIIGLSAIVAVGQLGLEIQFLTKIILVLLATTLTGASLAFGLGAKATISNILALYHIQRSFHIGQKIRIDDKTGKIIQMTPTCVTVESREGTWVLPGKIFNESATLIVGEHQDG